MKSFKPVVLVTSACAVLMLFSYFYFDAVREQYNQIVSFDTCTRAGFPVSATYPETCKVPGKVFVNEKQKALIVKSTSDIVASSSSLGFKNISYFIEGRKIDFVDGFATSSANEVLTQGTTTFHILDTIVTYDISGDSKDDIILIIEVTKKDKNRKMVIEKYLSVAKTLHNGYVGIGSIPLGVLTATTSLMHKNGKIILTSYTASSSQDFSRYFVLQGDILKEQKNP